MAIERAETPDPNVPQSLTDACPATWELELIEAKFPIRTDELIEAELPTARLRLVDTDPPTLRSFEQENEAPTRSNLPIEHPNPIITLSRTLTEAPTDSSVETDIADPSCAMPLTDMHDPKKPVSAIDAIPPRFPMFATEQDDSRKADPCTDIIPRAKVAPPIDESPPILAIPKIETLEPWEAESSMLKSCPNATVSATDIQDEQIVSCAVLVRPETCALDLTLKDAPRSTRSPLESGEQTMTR